MAEVRSIAAALERIPAGPIGARNRRAKDSQSLKREEASTQQAAQRRDHPTTSRFTVEAVLDPDIVRDPIAVERATAD